ncbi:MAG: DUF1801 domain-containing protein [Ignavibacteriaceae bacterium]|nr:DUF1801 domain-containing protein [Ignavibacteriaceae bacterium]
MAENKTVKKNNSVEEFLGSVTDPMRKEQCLIINRMMEAITGRKAEMWGESIVGFGDYHYTYASGREGDFFRVGYAPRRQNLSIYIIAGFERYPDLMEKLGKYKTGKSCLYVNKLEDIDMNILSELIRRGFNHFEGIEIKDKTEPKNG